MGKITNLKSRSNSKVNFPPTIVLEKLVFCALYLEHNQVYALILMKIGRMLLALTQEFIY